MLVRYGLVTDAVRPAPQSVVVAFNHCINARDLDGQVDLMTDDHTFVDSAGGTIDGKPACTKAWRGFFDAFPDYRNVFASIVADGGTVAAVGHSECSVPALAGPARWTATIRDGKIARWQVDEVQAV
jgi:ketosteroid isomerase-like protein